MSHSMPRLVRLSGIWLMLAVLSSGGSAAVDPPTYTISRVDLDGSNAVDILIVNSAMTAIALDTSAGKMYWTDAVLLGGEGSQYYAGRIMRANLDGSGQEVLVGEMEQAPRGIAVDSAAGKIYWTGGGPSNIMRSNLDGTAIEVVVESSNAFAIALDKAEGRIYWTTYVHGIWRATLDGADREQLVYDANALLRGISLDPGAGRMYWVRRSGPPAVLRAHLDGTEIETLVTSGLDSPRAVVVAPEHSSIYFTDFGASTVWRADLDGQARQPISSRPVVALAFDAQSDQLYFVGPAAELVPATNAAGLIVLAVLLVAAGSFLISLRRRA